MAKGYMQEIRERILSAEEGSVFSTSDFAGHTERPPSTQSVCPVINDESSDARK